MNKVDADIQESKNKSSTIAYEGSFVQLYISSPQVMFRLRSQCSLYLILWMINEMSDYNQIILNKGNRSSFLVDVKRYGRKYSDSSVRAAICELSDVEAIVSMSDEGKRESLYMVSPKHFWKARSQKDRMEVIKAFNNLIKSKDERDTI